MKKIVVAFILLVGTLLGLSVPANAASGTYLVNDRSSSYNAYYYYHNNCSGTRHTLPPGYGTTGAYSVKTYDRAWYIKWSNGNVTSRLPSGYCVNLPTSARVYA